MVTVEQTGSKGALVVEPTPKFELSRYLYMQFMEPLGATDGSVESSWVHPESRWRNDLIAVTRQLGPTMMRWGGCFASYYRWREGVGPRARRPLMHNQLWGGLQSNQVGTHEFVDFCRQVRAEPLLVVNFESDGRRHWARPGRTPPQVGKRGLDRMGTVAEAADWVAYCNSPRHAERGRNGSPRPLAVRFWQIGNETSYDPNGFDCETAAVKTVRFAKAMRKIDPTIKIIAWGDSGWAPRMIEVAGEYIDYIAFHNGYRSALANPPADPGPLNEDDYRTDPAATWRHLMSGADFAARKLSEIRSQTDGRGLPLALTEGHYSMPGRNRCDLMASWAVGVAYARIFNLYQRNGDALKIATLADFAGTRWLCNAVMLPTPAETGAYMMPVARVMSLFRHHTGRRAITVTRCPGDLDATASRTGDRVWLHVANTNRTRPACPELAIAGMKVVAGQCFQIAADPALEVWTRNADKLAPQAVPLPRRGPIVFPPASVTAIELDVAEAR